MNRPRFVYTSLLAIAVYAALPERLSGAANELRLLGSFETLEALGFTPDGVTYSPQGAELYVSSAADDGTGTQGVYRVTQDGELIRYIALPPADGLLGASITRATSGATVGHFYMATFNGLPTVKVFEFDRDFTLVGSFTVTGSVAPGDGIAFNHLTRNLVVVDGGSNELIEVTTSGDFVRTIPIPFAHVVGLTFNAATGTYFGVDLGGLLRELSPDGEQLRTFDLTSFGVKNPVGVGAGQGRLFIADEGDPSNSAGVVHILTSPRRGSF